LGSDVFFTKSGASHFNDSITDRLVKIFDRAGAGSIIKEKSLVAIKAHFGEPGNISFVSPLFYRAIADRVRICGGNPFICDTNTLYVGGRNNAVKHAETAVKHGFSFATVNAPVIIGDGLLGTDFVEVEVNKTHVKKAKIGSAFYWADAMIVVSHVKGHMMTGMGGAIKNIGMGCAARGGKQEQHSGASPKINSEMCAACRECLEWCGFSAIETDEETGRARINTDKCSGCGECLAVCRFDAISSKWDTGLDAMQEKMAEYALAAVLNKKNRVFYINFLLNITPECDCIPSTDGFLTPDIGIMASFDPVALDYASAEMINRTKPVMHNIEGKKNYDMKHAESDKFRMAHPETNWKKHIEHAEKIGLGSREYDIIEVE